MHAIYKKMHTTCTSKVIGTFEELKVKIKDRCTYNIHALKQSVLHICTSKKITKEDQLEKVHIHNNTSTVWHTTIIFCVVYTFKFLHMKQNVVKTKMSSFSKNF